VQRVAGRALGVLDAHVAVAEPVEHVLVALAAHAVKQHVGEAQAGGVVVTPKLVDAHHHRARDREVGDAQVAVSSRQMYLETLRASNRPSNRGEVHTLRRQPMLKQDKGGGGPHWGGPRLEDKGGAAHLGSRAPASKQTKGRQRAQRRAQKEKKRRRKKPPHLPRARCTTHSPAEGRGDHARGRTWPPATCCSRCAAAAAVCCPSRVLT